MIRPLRQTHYVVWIVLAILFPIGFLVSRWAIPKPAAYGMTTSKANLGKSLGTWEGAGGRWSLRMESGQFLLEWINLQNEPVASAALYIFSEGEKDASKGTLIGCLDGSPRQLFSLPADIRGMQVRVYDFIHQQWSGTINCRP